MRYITRAGTGGEVYGLVLIEIVRLFRRAQCMGTLQQFAGVVLVWTAAMATARGAPPEYDIHRVVKQQRIAPQPGQAKIYTVLRDRTLLGLYGGLEVLFGKFHEVDGCIVQTGVLWAIKIKANADETFTLIGSIERSEPRVHGDLNTVRRVSNDPLRATMRLGEPVRIRLPSTRIGPRWAEVVITRRPAAEVPAPVATEPD